MTNAEKFLKDGVSIEEFAKVIKSYYYNSPFESELEAVESFLKAPVQPTLTEDERAILRNLEPKMWNTILREEDGDIAFGYKLSKRYRSLGRCEFYNHLFQFIKERRRILDSRTFKIKYAHLPGSRQSLRTRTRKQTPCACADY